jgi:hypothetical protein
MKRLLIKIDNGINILTDSEEKKPVIELSFFDFDGNEGTFRFNIPKENFDKFIDLYIQNRDKK